MTALALSQIAPAAANMLSPLGRWPQTLLNLLRNEPAVIRVVIASLRGSGPREAGASMLVTRQGIAGTVGGGHLEWKAIADARALLEAPPGSAQLRRYVLGIELGQCCGGVVEIWFERYDDADHALLRAAASAMRAGDATVFESRLDGGTSTRTLRHATQDRPVRLVREHGAPSSLFERLDEPLAPLWIFGAGHVGQAIARLLDGLPFSLSWIDTRAGLFPSRLPDHAQCFSPADPVSMIAAAPAGTRFLILTHDHQLDYALCRAVLNRGDSRVLGVIGSDSKAARFRSRLARDGLAADQIARMICPIGIAGIASKQPAVIAIAVVAQLLQGLGDKPAQEITPNHPQEDCAINTPGGCAVCGNRKP